MAKSAAAMWSVPPAEPPPHETEPGSALSLAMRSSSVLMSESTGTAMASHSEVSRAIGVTSAKVTGDLFDRMAPTITRPDTISELPSPFFFANWAIPTVPPAPATFSTVTDFTMPAACRTSCMTRAVPSQPPPGAAGAMIVS